MLKYVSILAPVLWTFVAQAQNIEQRLQASQAHNSANRQEKVYVHTDRSSYTAGETIWYKTYNTIGIENILSTLSGINHIELIDPKDQVVADQRIQLGMGLGAGSITLADTLVEGTYRLRAYTNWMRNFPADYLFDTPLIITNGRTDNTITETSLLTEDKGAFIGVYLKTIQRNPLNKVTVRYQVMDGEKVVQRGSERTDEQGLIKIKASEKTENRKIVLSFTNLDERPVSKVIYTAAIKPQSKVHILPEGGHILANELNNLGIKAVRSDGMGVKATVEVLNAKEEVVGSVQTNDLGMGGLTFFPSSDDTYTFRATVDGAPAQIVETPEIGVSGMSFMVNNQNPSRLFAQVNLSEDQLSEDPLYLVVHHLGVPFYASRQTKNRKNIVFNLPKEDLPSGVVTLSVLNESFQPVLERPVFIWQERDFFSLAVSLNKPSFGSREKVTVDINSGSEADSIRLAAMSASVVHISKLRDTADYHTNIWSALLLQGDLRGQVENPGYYFSAENRTSKLLDLDKLMLTQGWRKFDWSETGSADTTKAFPVEHGLQIKGYTKKLGRKAAAPQSEVQLISADNLLDYTDTLSTDEGFFSFNNLLFPDSAKFLLSAKDQKGKNNIDIVLDQPTTPDFSSSDGGKNDLNTLYLNEILASKRFFNELEQKGLMPNTIDIDEVVVTRKEKKVPDHSRNLNGPGNADQIISSEDLERFPTVDMALNGRLLGVYFQGGVPHSTRSRQPMQLILDGMYVEADMLTTIPVIDIASVEVLRNVNYTTIYGSFGGNGVIVITTKLGSEGRLNYTPKGILSFTAKGISTAKQFYKPLYEEGSAQTFDNDLRTTIHWEPFIATDKEGTTSFDFYTADESGTYRIIVEGVDLNGRIGREVLNFDVSAKK